MAIAYQPAMTAEAVRTRPISTDPEPTRVEPAAGGLSRSPHTLMLIEEPARAWTMLKIAGLVAITALSTALAVAIVVGGALFAVLTIG